MQCHRGRGDGPWSPHRKPLTAIPEGVQELLPSHWCRRGWAIECFSRKYNPGPEKWGFFFPNSHFSGPPQAEEEEGTGDRRCCQVTLQLDA